MLTWPTESCVMWSRCNSPISPDKTPPHMLCPSLLSVLEHSRTTLFSGLPCLECPSLHPFLKIASSGKPSLSGKASVEISSSYYTLYSTMYCLGSSYHNCNFYSSWEILSSVDIPFSPTSPHSHPSGTDSDYCSCCRASSVLHQAQHRAHVHCVLMDWINEDFKCMPRM